MRSHRTPTGIIESRIGPGTFRPPRSPHALRLRAGHVSIWNRETRLEHRVVAHSEKMHHREGDIWQIHGFFRDSLCDRQASCAAGAV